MSVEEELRRLLQTKRFPGPEDGKKSLQELGISTRDVSQALHLYKKLTVLLHGVISQRKKQLEVRARRYHFRYYYDPLLYRPG